MGLFGGIGKVLGAAGSLGSVIPGPWQPFAAGAAVLGGAIGGAEKEAQADKLNSQATQIALERYNQTAPARNKALALAMQAQPGRENLDAIYADPGNPYARTIDRPAMAPPAPMGPVAGPGPRPPMAAPGIPGPQVETSPGTRLPHEDLRALKGRLFR